MAIYQQNGTPIVNGLSAIMTGAGISQSYTRVDAQVIPTGAALAFFSNLEGRYLAQDWAKEREVQDAVAGDYATAAAGGDAIIYLPAQPNRRHVLFGASCSYDATPTAGALSIESPSGTIVFRQSVAVAGPTPFEWFKGIHGSGSADMLVRLANGGQAKEVSLLGHRME